MGDQEALETGYTHTPTMTTQPTPLSSCRNPWEGSILKKEAEKAMSISQPQQSGSLSLADVYKGRGHGIQRLESGNLKLMTTRGLLHRYED